jgi:phosphotransferase system enzyme I (PtsI)
LIDDAITRSDQVTQNILEVHVMLMEDETLTDALVEKVEAGCTTYEAIVHVFDLWIKTFSEMDNTYMNERCSDLRDIKKNMLESQARIRNGRDSKANRAFEREPFILFTHELTPSQLAGMDTAYLKGIVTRTGGETSHAAIMSKSLGIPMMVAPFEEIKTGDYVLLDAVEGALIVNPSEASRRHYDKNTTLYRSFQSKLCQVHESAKPYLEQVQVNLGDLDDLKKASQAHSSGVGLFRTEFLFMKSQSMPSEQAQFQAYKTVLEAFGTRPVTVRTIDIGGDKALSYLDLGKEENPFLGYRAIRMCLNTHKSVFVSQLRAILRASVYGKARIMFPMVSTLNELYQAKRILESVQAELRAEGVAYDEHIPVGIMIEVPSAALLSEILAKHVDFFSIGTNDLTQYTMAADRMNQNVAYLYSYFEPAVLALVEKTIQAGLNAGIDVSVCGEMASNPLAVALLKQMGLKKYSVSPSRTNAVRYILERLGKENKSKEVRLFSIESETRDHVMGKVKPFMQRYFGEELNWL